MTRRKAQNGQSRSSKQRRSSLKSNADKQETPLKSERFAVIGIGASAGGLSALTEFFNQVPEQPGVAFVVVMHLSPDHESVLSELLQPHVALPVLQVQSSTLLEKDHVYIIPPNANLSTIDSHLRLSKLEKCRHKRATIDHFFGTLAQTQGMHAIGVILTGTGTDGTQGLREIKKHGGLTVVQDPDTAEFSGMPQSAIRGAPIDLILPVAHIPGAILRIVHTEPQIQELDDRSKPSGETVKFLHEALKLIRTQTGRDFTCYKASTILRRISRRMQFHNTHSPKEYLNILAEQPKETLLLADEFLITVTSFFRDREVFETLGKTIIPQIFKAKSESDQIRVWSAGCATGEEAYSLAILLLEEAEGQHSRCSLRILASDLHQTSIEKAREGFYPHDIEVAVSPERLKRFFHKETSGYRVCKEVRDLVIFTPHNLLADPPFSNLDLISCRNLFIYLEQDLQRRLIEIFHYALRPNGVLILGTSESLDSAELFQCDDKKLCIYRKRDVPSAEPRLPVFPISRRYSLEDHDVAEVDSSVIDYGLIHREMLDHCGPASMLINPEDKIVHLSERAGRYLVHPGGNLTANVFKLVRKELSIELRAILPAARNQYDSMKLRPVTVHCDGKPTLVTLRAEPSSDAKHKGFVLVMFEEHEGEEFTRDFATPTEQHSVQLRQMESEWEITTQRLESIIKDHEKGKQELRASNEELHSANEELRSTLEELETSKEELQSMNEELQTLNQENRRKVQELNQLSSDLQNLFAATDIATLFLDRQLRILRFTPKITDLFSVEPSDCGRPLSNFAHSLNYSELQQDAIKVLEHFAPIQREIRDDHGRWYLTRLLPYRDGKDHIGGVVVTFVDITERKHFEDEVRMAKEYAEHIIESLPDPLLVLDSNLRICSANVSFYEQFRVEPKQTVGVQIYEVGNRQWDIPPLRKLLEEVLPQNKFFNGYRVDYEFESIGRRVMLLNGRSIDGLQLILLGIHDITERYEAEAALRESEERYRALAELSPDAILVNANERYVYANESAARLLVADSPQMLLGLSLLEIFAPESCGLVAERVRQVKEGKKESIREEYQCKKFDGTCGDIEVAAGRIDWQGKPAVQFVARDMTERKHLEQKLRKAADRLIGASQRKDQYLAMLGHELRNPMAAIRNATEMVKLIGGKDDNLDRAIGILERQSSHVTKLLDDLLEVSRIVKGKLHLTLAPLNLEDVLQSVLMDSLPDVKAAGLTLKENLTGNPLWVSGDRVRLAQVLDNLISNAIKFTNAPGSISVTTIQDGDKVKVSVQDTGIGLHPEALSRIFDTFHQEPQGTIQTMGGLGLGLSLAKGLVDLHHGVISAHSNGPGTGTEFNVWLPLTAAKKVVSAPSPERPQPCRILLIEDSGDIAFTYSFLLKKYGHQVMVARKGEEGLGMLREHGADIILCDIGLPEMSGYEFAQQVRQDPVLSEIPLVALTGYGQPDDRKRTLEADFDEHLVKPVAPDELDRVIARFSRGRTQ